MESVWLLIYIFAIPLLTAIAVSVVMRRIIMREMLLFRAECGEEYGGEHSGGGAAAESAFSEIKRAYSLTDRETEILMELFEGNGNRVIAAKLFISENTVKTHIHNLLQKMESASRVEAVDKVRLAMTEPESCAAAG